MSLINNVENIAEDVVAPLKPVTDAIKSAFIKSPAETMPNFPNTPAGLAATNAWKSGVRSNSSSGISGSAKINMNTDVAKATKGATQSLLSSQNTGTSSSGKSAASPTDSAGAPSPSTTTASYVDPLINSYTVQYNQSVDAENKNYSQQLNDANETFLPAYNQTKSDQQSAVAQAGAAYDAQNPHASAEERAEYLSIVSSSFDNNLAEMTAQHQATLDGINQNHSSNLLNLQSSFNSSIAAQYQQNFTNLNTLLTTNPPDQSKLGSLMAGAMSGDPDSVQAFDDYVGPYLQYAMGTGQFSTPQEALSYIMNPTLGEKKLAVSEETAGATASRAATASEALTLQQEEAGSTTVAQKSESGFQGIFDSLFNKPVQTITKKSLGTPTSNSVDSSGNNIPITANNPAGI